MAIGLDHTIVYANDAEASARWLTDLFELTEPVYFANFWVVETANGVNLDFRDTDGEVASQHYAFLVGDDEFDAIFGRITDRELPHWADSNRTHPDRINHREGGRGVYFESPDGHLLEIITRSYGS